VITLVLGGARSGKSAVAERLAAQLPEPVTYVATAVATDEDMAARIAAHRARRPPEWRTVEASVRLADELAGVAGSVLLDALGTWVARAPGFEVDLKGLCRELGRRPGDSIIVSEEVGLGVHPSSEAGRRFRDSLGEVNQAVADIADDVLLVVAGRTLHLDHLDRV
jgi:adenosylcobinamide kinase / adenosylcobinamide-phosphate guanylyltransferase